MPVGRSRGDSRFLTLAPMERGIDHGGYCGSLGSLRDSKKRRISQADSSVQFAIDSFARLADPWRRARARQENFARPPDQVLARHSIFVRQILARPRRHRRSQAT